MTDFNPYSPPGASLEMAVQGNMTHERLNPWLSIWTRPRATIQQLVEQNPQHLVLLLAAIGGFSEALDRASMRNMGDKFDLFTIFAMAAVGGPVLGIAGLYLGGALLRWTGRWIGGIASPVNIRAALAWSNVPLVWALILWLPSLALFGKELFTTDAPSLEDQSLLGIFIGLGAIELAIGIWSFVVLLKCLGQVQGFSAWKALGNLLLAGLVVVVPIALLVAALYGLSR